MSRRCDPNLTPAGFFRFTLWSHTRGQTFESWAEHFRQRGIRTILVETRIGDGRKQVALFVEGKESTTDDTARERERVSAKA